LARSRTHDMLRHYGRNITSMPIETLVSSCYLQGVEDCFRFYEKQASRDEPEGQKLYTPKAKRE
jgi:hypothetical protein